MKLPKENPTKQTDDFFTILGNQFRLIGFSWNAFRLNFITFAALFLLPYIIVSGLLMAWLPNDLVTAEGELNMKVAEEFVRSININAAVVAAIGIVIVGSVLALANIATQLQSVQGKKLSVPDAIEQAWPLLPRMIGLILLMLLVSALWLASFALPGIGLAMIMLAVIFFTLLAFFGSLTLFVMVEEQTGPVESVKRSLGLVKRNWKIILAYFVLTFIISLPGSVLGQFGGFISMLLSIAYLCLPALLYLRITYEAAGAKTASSSKRRA